MKSLWIVLALTSAGPARGAAPLEFHCTGQSDAAAFSPSQRDFSFNVVTNGADTTYVVDDRFTPRLVAVVGPFLEASADAGYIYARLEAGDAMVAGFISLWDGDPKSSLGFANHNTRATLRCTGPNAQVPSTSTGEPEQRCVKLSCGVDSWQPFERKRSNPTVTFDATTEKVTVVVNDRIVPPLIAEVTQNCQPSDITLGYSMRLVDGTVDVVSVEAPVPFFGFKTNKITAEFGCKPMDWPTDDTSAPRRNSGAATDQAGALERRHLNLD